MHETRRKTPMAQVCFFFFFVLLNKNDVMIDFEGVEERPPFGIILAKKELALSYQSVPHQFVNTQNGYFSDIGWGGPLLKKFSGLEVLPLSQHASGYLSHRCQRP